MGFRGSYCHAFDGKGRVAIPVRFREELRAANDERVVVTRNLVGDARCLDVYPNPIWAALEGKVELQERFDPRAARFRRFFFSEAQDAAVDKQGRILVSQRLREYAGLDREVLFVSDFDKFQIWAPEVWSRVAAQDEEVFVSQPESMRIGF